MSKEGVVYLKRYLLVFSLYKENNQHSTFPTSTHLVNIAIVAILCSQTMRQRSPTVLGTGPEMDKENVQPSVHLK